MKKLLFILGALLITSYTVSAQTFCGNYAITENYYAETADLDSAVEVEFGEDYKIAEWRKLKEILTTPEKVDSAMECLGVLKWWDPEGGDAFFILDSGRYFVPDTEPKQVYYGQHYESGKLFTSGTGIKDTMGYDKLVLAAWYGVSFRILAVKDEPPLGIKKNSFSTYYKLYPNPAQNELKLDSHYGYASSTEISIINTSGQVMLKSPIKPSLNISALKPGVYLLRVTDNKGISVISQRFVKH